LVSRYQISLRSTNITYLVDPDPSCKFCLLAVLKKHPLISLIFERPVDLVKLGLLDKDDKGLLSAPFDEIVIHAPVRDAA